MTARPCSVPFITLQLVLLSWTTPSAGQTVLTSDTNSDPLFGIEFVHASGRTWFSALNPIEGGEVWRTDGTSANTVVVGEATPGNDIDRPIELLATGNKVYYLVDGDSDWEVWTSDGTPGGTQLVVGSAAPSFADKNPAVNGLAATGDYVLAFAESWLVSINVASGDTTRLRPGNGEGFVAATDFVYAFAQHPASFAEELIRTDGTKQGTTVLAEVFYPDEDVIGIAGNQLLFLSDGGVSIGEELFVSDGTIGGTGFLAEMVAGDADIHCSSVTSVGPVAYLGLLTSPGGQCQPWRTDGTTAGTELVVDTTGALIREFSVAVGYVWYWEGAGNLWRTDGTRDNTIMIASFDGPSAPVVAFDGRVYFAAFESGSYTLWQSDGTPGGTSRVFADTTPIDPLSMTVIGDRLYFSSLNTYFLEATSTGINDLAPLVSSLDFDAYPNPFDNDVTVAVDGVRAFTAVVYDVLGRVVGGNANVDASGPVTLELSGLAPGVYFIRVLAGRHAGIRRMAKI